MCGRYFIEISDEELLEIIAEAERNQTGRYEAPLFLGGDIFPSAIVPVVTNTGARFMKWGFPNLAPDRPPLINAKSETAHTLRTFSDAMMQRRCLVPATAYYEWQDVGKKKKDKYEFALPEQGLFYMAGIFAPNNDFAILTRQATIEFMPIHDRMPVIIPRSHAREWLVDSPLIPAQTATNFTMRRVA